MSPQDFERMLLETLEDRKLSRSERKAVSSILQEVRLPEQQLAVCRSIAFRLARDAQRNVLSPPDVLDWLEDVLKLLRPAAGSGEDSRRSEAYFSPGEDCRRRISSLFRQAQKSADVCVFTITDNRISKEIIAAARGGVRIRVISDDDKAFDRGSDIAQLEQAGVAVRVDRTRHHMHHKFAIFDESDLLTGSYNWTRSASEHNEENMIVTDDSSLIAQFQREFDTLWARFA